MYSLLIILLSRQSVPVSFRVCINLVHFTRSNVRVHVGREKMFGDTKVCVCAVLSCIPLEGNNEKWSHIKAEV